jgi:hypothetical protein
VISLLTKLASTFDGSVFMIAFRLYLLNSEFFLSINPMLIFYVRISLLSKLFLLAVAAL